MATMDDGVRTYASNDSRVAHRIERHVGHLSVKSRTSPVFGKKRKPIKFPDHGTDFDTVVDDLRKLKVDDAAWEGGRVPMFVFKGSTAAGKMARAGYNEFFKENALGAGRSFPSLKNMERDLVSMALDLFHGPKSATGYVTTGGTESIIVCLRTCRNYSRYVRKDPKHRGNIVLSFSAHPAFDKGADMMDIEIRRTPVGPDYRADVAAMKAAVDDDTIMIVGSAPNYPFGTFDPITELATFAKGRNLWMHVDACVGGYLSPFVKGLGRHIPDWDFSVDGVVSITADLHKYAYAPKNISTVFYRSRKYSNHQPFVCSEWPVGAFLTNTIVGTRAGGAIGGAWAVMKHLGRSGYEAIARDLMAAIDKYCTTINRMPGLKVLGEPELSIVAFGTDETANFDIFRVGEVMEEKGWQAGLLQQPRAMHRMMSTLHADSMDEYLRDLEVAVAQVSQESRDKKAKKATITAKY